METKIREFLNNKNNKCIFFSVLFFSAAAHMYRWVNPGFNHDSLLLYQEDYELQISVGRYLNPIYVRLRGMFTPPWLIAMISLFFLLLSVKLITDVLAIRSRFSLVLISAVLSAFPALSCAYASFLPWTDIYMFCLLLSAASVFFLLRFRLGWILSVLCLVPILALYQSYLETAVMLFLLWFIRECTISGDLRFLLRKAALFAAVLLTAGGVYYLGWKLFLHIYQVIPADRADFYTSIKGITDFSGYNIPALAAKAYLTVIRYFLHPLSSRSSGGGWINVLIFLAAAVPLSMLLRECQKKVLFVILLLISPLAANFIYVISKGVHHSLMIYSFSFFYVLVFLLFETRSVMNEKFRAMVYAPSEKAVLSVLFLLMISDFIVFANQIYLERELSQQATLSVMTRVVNRMEETEGYIPGKTEVVLLGKLNDSVIAVPDARFENIRPYQTYAVTYYESYLFYFNNILQYPFSAASGQTIEEYKEMPETAEMPAFPETGCCKMIGGRLVVKLSGNIN